MRLNPDCTRAVLLAVEELSDGSNFLDNNAICESIRGDFPDNVIEYHVKQCDMAGLLDGYSADILGGWYIRDLSPAGHEFIAKIRSDTVWAKLKKYVIDAGIGSIPALIQAAATLYASGVFQA